MKLYWRVKVDGKWTWRPADAKYCDTDGDIPYYYVYIEEEEE